MMFWLFQTGNSMQIFLHCLMKSRDIHQFPTEGFMLRRPFRPLPITILQYSTILIGKPQYLLSGKVLIHHTLYVMEKIRIRRGCFMEMPALYSKNFTGKKYRTIIFSILMLL